LLISTDLAHGDWRVLAPGMALGTFPTGQSARTHDSRLTLLRIDPKYWSLEFVGVDLSGESNARTARQWSKDHRLTAVINAGMFAKDHKTHVGYLRFRDQVYNHRINHYRSVAAFDPRRQGLPPFRLFDLDRPGIDLETILRDYASAVQNLRLIKRPGENRWQRRDRRWSEAALGEDGSGRMLFIFCPYPYAMHDFNDILLKLDIGVVAAQHLEGGSQAQLYIDAGGVELELTGHRGNTFSETHDISLAWPIPNVLGVRPRASSRQAAEQDSTSAVR
jgi:hypothetical protein